ncbi:PEP-CTERM sorting domain-containing protein [candidate division KSB1 bacterium]|nr:PEP-CTERM sorting domain-containing protein [candidate division KSB1 bacterium]
MKKQLTLLFALLILTFCFTLNSFAININLYVDSAPNKYGSPNWAPWWNQTKIDVVAGTFTNMRTGTYPGTLYMDPYDEIVYSTGDLGKRLHWIYWLPGQTTSGLNNLFQVKWVIDWAGSDWTYQGGGWALDGHEIGWSQPASWEDYSGGVIGSLGFAWWATDDDALPLDTNGNPYDETNQADIDALRNLVFANQTFANGLVRYRSAVDQPWEYSNIQVNMIPEPGTFLLLGFGLIGLAGLSRKKLLKKS